MECMLVRRTEFYSFSYRCGLLHNKLITQPQFRAYSSLRPSFVPTWMQHSAILLNCIPALQTQIKITRSMRFVFPERGEHKSSCLGRPNHAFLHCILLSNSDQCVSFYMPLCLISTCPCVVRKATKQMYLMFGEGSCGLRLLPDSIFVLARFENAYWPSV